MVLDSNNSESTRLVDEHLNRKKLILLRFTSLLKQVTSDDI